MVYKEKSKDRGQQWYSEFKGKKKHTNSKFEKATKGKMEDEYYVDIPNLSRWIEREEC